MPTNADRASWAEEAARTFAKNTGLDPDVSDEWPSILGDLLADLHHLADLRGVDFFEAQKMASVHYNDERYELWMGEPKGPRTGSTEITAERRIQILETVDGRTPCLDCREFPGNEDEFWWQHWAALDNFAVNNGMVWNVSPAYGGMWHHLWTSARVDLLGGGEPQLTQVRTRVFDHNPHGPDSRWWACGRVEDALLLLELLQREPDGRPGSGSRRLANFP